MLSASENQVLRTIAADLGTTPAALSALITFESGFNPKAKNPYSSARGLIQFTDTTARGLGFKDSLDLITRFPTIEKQLLIVHKYLKKYAPFRDDQEIGRAHV
jgi:soluble lytic murein transglycosylase-like protein